LDALCAAELSYSHSDAWVRGQGDLRHQRHRHRHRKTKTLSLAYKDPKISVVSPAAIVRFNWVSESEAIADGKKSSTNLHILMNWQKQGRRLETSVARGHQALIAHFLRHARTCCGHPRLNFFQEKQDVDCRVKFTPGPAEGPDPVAMTTVAERAINRGFVMPNRSSKVAHRDVGGTQGSYVGFFFAPISDAIARAYLFLESTAPNNVDDTTASNASGIPAYCS